jgi:hypothetical protein
MPMLLLAWQAQIAGTQQRGVAVKRSPTTPIRGTRPDKAAKR